MAGLNKGVVTGNAFIGARCSTVLGCDVNKRKVTYYPGYANTDGKPPVNARCTVRAIVNVGNGKAYNYTFVGWGKLADFMAKRMSPGVEFSCNARPQSFLSDIYDETGKPILKSDGERLRVERHTFAIERDTLRITAESRKVIDAEILSGGRPANWDDNGQGHEAWIAMQKAKDIPYNGTNNIFGHAKVIKKTGVAPAATPQAPVSTPELAAQVAAVLANMQGNVQLQAAGAGVDPGNPPW